MTRDAVTYKIAVAGAPETSHFGDDALDIAKELGRQIAMHEALAVTGAVTGFPMWVAMGAEEAGGTVIGFSPATSKDEHQKVYRLPTDHLTMPIYTGFGYAGRDLLMVRSSDAIIFGPGKVATINAFTVALEEGKVIGVLEGDWKTDELLQKIIKESEEGVRKIIFDKDPKKLVEQVLKRVKYL